MNYFCLNPFDDLIRGAALLLNIILFIALSGCTVHEIPDDSSSVLTYNVNYDRDDYTGTIGLIADSDADILCLQEVTPTFEKAFTSVLNKKYPFRYFKPQTGTWGMAIAAKYRLQNQKVFIQQPHKMPAIEADIDLPTGRTKIACIHLFPPIAKRSKEINWFTAIRENASLRYDQGVFLENKFHDTKSPLILAGDFNEWRGDDVYDHFIAGGYTDSCSVSGSDCSGSWPGNASICPAIFQIDNILGKDLNFVQAKVIKGGNSDHYPLVAYFIFEGK